jgi:hypothetical protein
MIIGINSRDNDLVVNPVKTKQLTNVRASGKDEAIVLVPPIQLTLESAVEFIADDELVEITPKSIRLRKRHLKEHERRRAGSREAAYPVWQGRDDTSLLQPPHRVHRRQVAPGALHVHAEAEDVAVGQMHADKIRLAPASRGRGPCRRRRRCGSPGALFEQAPLHRGQRDALVEHIVHHQHRAAGNGARGATIHDNSPPVVVSP